MSIAVIKTGGKQYKVKKDDVILVELLSDDKKTVVFDDLLSSKKVEAKVLGEAKGPKIRTLKFKNKVRYTKRHGHRQKYNQIQITDIHD